MLGNADERWKLKLGVRTVGHLPPAQNTMSRIHSTPDTVDIVSPRHRYISSCLFRQR